MADIGWRRRRGSSPAAPTGARQRAGLTPPPAPTHFHASGRRFTHNSSGQSKNPLTAITVSTAPLGLNEPIALRRVEPLHGSFGHRRFLELCAQITRVSRDAADPSFGSLLESGP